MTVSDVHSAEHRVDLDQPVQRYLPGILPVGYPSIPVYALLDHTSGLPSVSETAET